MLLLSDKIIALYFQPVGVSCI